MSKPSKVVVYPLPPDSTRIQFLTKISTSAEITGVRSGFEKMILGAEEAFEIKRPYGLSAIKNKLFVVDNLINAIYIINYAEHSFNIFQPDAWGALKKPINCFVDSDEKLYIADAERGDIVVFDKDLKLVKYFGKESLEKPVDVFVYKDKIYVADIKLNNIMIFDKNDYRFLNPLVDAYEADTAFIHQPTNITIEQDVIYVSDVGESNIKAYDMKGNFQHSYGTVGVRHGDLVRPKGIAVDRDENLYVVDAAFENVQIFNKFSKVLMSFGGPYKGPGDMYLPAKVIVDYNNNDFFQQFVEDNLILKYVVYVSNNYGPDKITIYGAVEQR